MAKDKGGSLSINYHLKSGVGKPSDKMQVNLNRTGKGIHLVYNAGIESLSDLELDTVESLLADIAKLDDKNATKEQHVAACRTTAKAMNTLADFLEK